MHPFRQTRIPDHLFAAYQVSMQFLRDFEKSGIALPDVKRHQFVQLSDAAILLGRTFLQPPETSSSILSLSDRDASALGNSFKSRLARSGDNYEILVQSAETQAIAQNHPYEGVRRRAWEALNRIGSEHVKVLDELLQVRAATAHLLGKQSWAHVILEDKMAESPGKLSFKRHHVCFEKKLDNVMSFLDGLSKHNASEMRNEVELLRGAKKVQRASEPSDIAIWDRDYYSSLTSTIPTSARSYRSFFSVGTVIEGLSRLFSSLFGVSFQHVEPDANESFWHSTVRKLEVVDERNGKLGYIYCDLFSRPGKPHGAAHYTIRCSRRTDDDDSDGDLAFGQDIPPITSLVQPGNTIRKGREGRWQLPTVVLSCDFDFSADQVATLNWNEVETLFHEVGHAIHCKFVRLCKVHVLTDTSAMQGQVEYHNVSGTRCATDFVELPSILMEHFCSSPQVLSLYARHHSTDAPLPHQFLSDIKSSSFPAFEQAHQITLAALDQAYHSSAPLEQPKWNSTETWYEIYEKYGTGCKGLRGSGTNWQTRFTHLVGYGASYYSYLFDRVIASQVWLQIFKASGGLSREAGEKYRREVLQHGGGKDPWQCLASLLENENIAKGGIEAMVEVGKWGINAPT